MKYNDVKTNLRWQQRQNTDQVSTWESQRKEMDKKKFKEFSKKVMNLEKFWWVSLDRELQKSIFQKWEYRRMYVSISDYVSELKDFCNSMKEKYPNFGKKRDIIINHLLKHEQN